MNENNVYQIYIMLKDALQLTKMYCTKMSIKCVNIMSAGVTCTSAKSFDIYLVF